MVYEGAKTATAKVYGNTKMFEMRVGLHLCSFLSSFLFVLAVGILKSIRHNELSELLCTDNLAIITKSEEELQRRIRGL